MRRVLAGLYAALVAGCTATPAAPDGWRAPEQQLQPAQPPASAAPTEHQGPLLQWGHRTDAGPVVDLQLWPGPADFRGLPQGQCFVAALDEAGHASPCIPPAVIRALVATELAREQAAAQKGGH
jgi:hypothetical protein